MNADLLGIGAGMTVEIIGLIIAVVGIVLQLSDAFPEHRETRKVIVVLAIGVFLGMVASASAGATYNVTGNVDAKWALLFGLAGLVGLFGLIAAFSNSDARQQIAFTVSGGAGVLFLITGFAIALGSQAPVYNYSTDEILQLAQSAEQRGQYEIAITRLEEAHRRLESTPGRLALKRRIARLQAIQSGAPAGGTS